MMKQILPFCLLCLSLLPARGAEALRLSWTNNLLTISGAQVPGELIQIWYLEAFCRPGSTHRDWSQTVIPHATELLSASGDGQHLRLRSVVEPNLVVEHDIRSSADEVDFRLRLENRGKKDSEAAWFQPCLRVDRFTGAKQSNYVAKSFIFTRDGLRILDQMARAENAIYRGGQVYVPGGIPLEDVNPRPISPEVPVNGLIGCFSQDGKSLLATAWDQTQELFQGVIVCLHNDPRVGGLKAGEKKELRGKLYVMKNDPAELLRRYHVDFGK